MKLFSKTVTLDSNESYINHQLSKISPSNTLFCPVKTKKNNKKKIVTLFWEELPCTLYDVLQTKKVTTEQLFSYFVQIKDQLSILHRSNILHSDVHFKNIMMTKTKKKVYLIDYGLSPDPQKLSSYDKLTLLWDEDLFQLLWNLVFRTNQTPTDYKEFRKLLRKQTMDVQESLEKSVLPCIPTRHRKKCKNFLIMFFSKKSPLLKTNHDRIMFKLFLERMYLCFYFYFVNFDVSFEKFISCFQQSLS